MLRIYFCYHSGKAALRGIASVLHIALLLILAAANMSLQAADCVCCASRLPSPIGDTIRALCTIMVHACILSPISDASTRPPPGALRARARRLVPAMRICRGVLRGVPGETPRGCDVQRHTMSHLRRNCKGVAPNANHLHL